jgi:hypothetical protein
MTGSGKTGLLSVMVEEALYHHIPALIIDVKGDLPNLLLAFPDFSPTRLEPWVDPEPDESRGREELARSLATERAAGLRAWGIDEAELASFHDRIAVRVITPGSHAGEALHVLSCLERPTADWNLDPTSARASLAAAISLVLRLLGRDPDPACSREHVLLSVLAERRLRQGLPSRLEDLLQDLADPPLEKIGALAVDRFVSKRDRGNLAAALNALLASPSFAAWREGAPLDIESWLTPGADGRTAAVIVSVAHLDDEERMLVLGILLEETLTWMRKQSGCKRLRALLVFDEVYGFLPPHPANPPTKRPLVALMKQARAFGVGVLIATQNPMDLDYRALSNAGLWCVGRLQTDADRARVIEGLSSSETVGADRAALSELTKNLEPRWFVLRDVHAQPATQLLQPRWAMSFLRGPMTGREISRALEQAQQNHGQATSGRPS